MYEVKDMLALVQAVTNWRSVHCLYRKQCDGENHLEDCPVEIALQEILTIHNRMVPR